ncbi:MAG: phosphatidylglycerophosphatase A [Chromatiales bacterium]|nr:phosphatidylglycerophosphatase A [Chromatiales bacterium]
MTDPIDTRRILRDPVLFVAFGFGSGLSPRAPGTVGTLAAILPYLLLEKLSLVPYLLVVALAFVLGVWLCQEASNRLGVHDHGGIVWDEFVGLWIALIAAPPGWSWLLLGFLSFRFFDILKPWPIGWLDRHVSGGLGIMVDDVAAGIAALAVLQGVSRLIGG